MVPIGEVALGCTSTYLLDQFWYFLRTVPSAPFSSFWIVDFQQIKNQHIAAVALGSAQAFYLLSTVSNILLLNFLLKYQNVSFMST